LHKNSLSRIVVTVSSWIICFYTLTVKLKTIRYHLSEPETVYCLSLVKLTHMFEIFSSFSLLFDTELSHLASTSFEGDGNGTCLGASQLRRQVFCRQLWHFHLL